MSVFTASRGLGL